MHSFLEDYEGVSQTGKKGLCWCAHLWAPGPQPAKYQPHRCTSPCHAMSFPMMASYAALFGLWSLTQFVLVSAWSVALLYNGQFSVCFVHPDRSKCPEPPSHDP